MRAGRILVCLGLFVLISEAAHAKPPIPLEVRENNARHWLKQSKSPHADLRDFAMFELRAVGHALPEEVRARAQVLVKEDPSINVRLQSLILLGNLFRHGDEEIKMLLQEIGQGPDPVLGREALLQLELDPDDSYGAIYNALKMVRGKRVVLFYERTRGGRRLLLSSMRLQEDANKVRPGLTRLLRNKDWKMRRAAALALMKLEDAARLAIPALTKRLKDKHPMVRAAAAFALSAVGSLKSKHAKKLLGLLADEDWRVRSAAAHAFQKVQKPSDEVIVSLCQTLEDKIDYVGAAAASSLEELSDTMSVVQKSHAVLCLMKAVDREAWLTRKFAASSLNKFGSLSGPAVPVLIKTLRDPVQEVAEHAIYALMKVGSQAKAAVPELIRCLQQPQLKSEAIDALGLLGPAALPAVPALIKILNNSKESSNCRNKSVLALGKIGAGAKAAVPSLLKALKGKTLEGDWIKNALKAIGTPEALKVLE